MVATYPLSGLRILDMGTSAACALTARYLARLGAEVIKIEPPKSGDLTRRIGPHLRSSARGETGALHLFVNEGKKSLTLDIESASGQQLFNRLLPLADVIVEGWDRSAAGHLNFDDLHRLNPKAVLTSVSPFGRWGPYKDYLGTELTVFAMGGHMYRSGTLGRPPVRMGGLPSQVLGSLLAAFATLIAVRASEEQGFGQLVDFSLLENQVTSHAQSMVEVSYLGQETGANTPRIPNEGRRLFAKDGPVMFSVMEQQLPLLAELINAPAELAKSRPGERAGANPDLQRLITDWVGSRTQREVYEAGQAGHVPTSYSASPSDLLSSPQYESRNFWMPMTHGVAGKLKVPGLPFLWMREEPPAIPAPLLGQHTEPLLRELLGLSRLDVKRLFQAGVL